MSPPHTSGLLRPLVIALAVAVAVRLAAVLLTSFWPIPNEQGLPVSPLDPAPSSDLSFYERSKDLYLVHPLTQVLEGFVNFYSAKDLQYPLIVAAPLFPMLLAVFDYRSGNTLPMALFFVAVSCVVAWIWLSHFERSGAPLSWLLMLACLPHFVWFTVNVGTDLLSALFFAAFFWLYFNKPLSDRRLLWSLIALAGYLLTRPNGVSLLIFVVLDQLFLRKEGGSPLVRYTLLGALLATGPFSVFYFPYLSSFVDSTSKLTFFGTTAAEYYNGVFPDLPRWMDLFLSWSVLVVSKLIYLVGLRPSYAGTNDLIVLVRALPGLLFLPGIIQIMVSKDRSLQLLIILFIAPILLGAAQDRYTLPIQPLLLYYGLVFYKNVLGALPRLRKNPTT